MGGWFVRVLPSYALAPSSPRSCTKRQDGCSRVDEQLSKGEYSGLLGWLGPSLIGEGGVQDPAEGRPESPSPRCSSIRYVSKYLESAQRGGRLKSAPTADKIVAMTAAVKLKSEPFTLRHLRDACKASKISA